MLKSQRSTIAIAIGVSLMAVTTVHCQIFRHKKKQQPTVQKGATPADTTKKPTSIPVKPYKDVITADMKSSKGFITVHQKDEKYFFEVPNKMMGRDILIVSRISKASAEMRNGSSGYSGDQIGETVFRFELGPAKKLLLRRISFREYSDDSTKAMFASVQKNNVQAIAMAFTIAAYAPDSSGVVFDATDFVNSDNEVLYFQKKAFKDKAGMGAQANDRSFVDYVRAFASNVEVHAVKTYSAGLNPTSSSYTVELNSSMVLLPEKPMKPRAMDGRVGYFAVGHIDFDADPQGVKEKIYVKRWRLEPKPEDIEKYKRGELVEPAKPIVYYIDPTTPKKWVPYLMQGVNDWQKAFEKIGFKNAVYARIAPTKEEDSTWSIDDATHSAIIYRPSVIANAMGPSVSDPRSGEIIESHIFWYHNVMSLLQRWYMAQCGAVDPRALNNELPDSLMGQLIRFVSSHEVGHTLGLLHNFGSSSTVPVEKLRDKAWVEAHGHTPSIMDYARFNYVAQPKDHIGEAGLFPRINDYDFWAIQWGYDMHKEYKTAEEEKTALSKMVSDSLAANHRLYFGSEVNFTDARCQNEDLGDDAVKAGEYGIKNLKRLMPGVLSWAGEKGEDFDKPMEQIKTLYSQFFIYMGHAVANIGSVYVTENMVGDAGNSNVEPAPYEKQKAAMAFINKQLFETPTWLNSELLNRTTMNFATEINDAQRDMLNALLGRARFSRLLWSEQVYAAEKHVKVYTLTEMFGDLNKGIFTEAYAGKNVDMYRRALQKGYVARLMQQVFTSQVEGNISDQVMPFGFNFEKSDERAMVKDNLMTILALCKKQAANAGLDKLTKLHYDDIVTRINAQLAAEKQGLIK
ncbi:zinc-dependent metalloprotease [Chitinophaga sancti]|uniref:zinc-dependent metalloprotease n=1 Tax=Chitinophaga sancti TaxID=1004 RepID=UPI002A75CB3C|nr:zinc-dependent metalloprotease [Chitinophaga sancti]WPQ65265.1 zinc-dependent metalloprotease [Chitinophaga sancti]